MNHKGTAVLTSDRLILRRFEYGDAEAAYRNWMSDSEVTKYLCWQPHSDVSQTEETLRGWIPRYDDPSFYLWAIVLRELDQPIGSISVVGTDEELGIARIGYCIGKRWWRQGYMTEAFSAVIRFLFYEVGVNRIEAQHDPENPNSGRVMRKCGLKYEGTLRQADSNNRGIVDACVYSILRSEYLN